MKTCKDIGELLSDALTRWERCTVRLHLLICRHCSRFQNHLHFLHKAAECYYSTENDKNQPTQ